MCPPEYAELEGGKPSGGIFRNLNHTAPGPCYASTSVLDTQYPLPPLLPPTSSEEGGHTGETSCSGDSSSGGASGESRARRSRGRAESRASGSNSDSSGRGTTDTSRLGQETRLTASAAPSPYHRPPPGPAPATDPGLPPVPPLRGLSSYQVKWHKLLFNFVSDFLQGVRAGSFNSFGVGSSYSSGVEGLSGSHYSVPGLFSRLQVKGSNPQGATKLS